MVAEVHLGGARPNALRANQVAKDWIPLIGLSILIQSESRIFSSVLGGNQQFFPVLLFFPPSLPPLPLGPCVFIPFVFKVETWIRFSRASPWQNRFGPFRPVYSSTLRNSILPDEIWPRRRPFVRRESMKISQRVFDVSLRKQFTWEEWSSRPNSSCFCVSVKYSLLSTEIFHLILFLFI